LARQTDTGLRRWQLRAFGCTPNDLIKPKVVNAQVKKTADGQAEPLPLKERRTTIRRPGQP
jgi:hypothetical protein